ncbi:glucose-6-phosphate isomerase [Ornithinimicrobium pekingense]|uniref:Glucose-6-phosphate isomerase n=1 Tax=Ornithinimicrobium pekingense TaxID=384677 RepID=A0ABQ2FAA7_9MICO|nr:glucose-6-phosphate isomerase [Ornithinimicrobium pekingense]GGK74697.1 glucose-6-phosphate isomerase [Ornithinimicrobium pekingense]
MSALTVEALGAAADAVEQHLGPLVEERFASRLFAQDATLWGPEAESEAAVRLSWVGLPRSSRPLVGEVSALREQLRERGVSRIVLCGMGGSSLAPEVICATAGVPLVVLDSSDPDMVRAALEEDISATAVVVSSKSGSTLETDSQRRAFVQAFTDAGIDPTERVVIVTDPGSPLDEQSRADGYRVVNADPDVGGRYSALTAFGLVPSGLAGADIAALLDEAEEVADLLADDDQGNPGLRLGAALGGTEPLRDKLLFADAGSGISGLADWAEQLIAESTGKEGTGVLPVVVPAHAGPTDGLEDTTDCTVVALIADPDTDLDGDDGHDESGTAPAGAAAGSQVNVAGPLGAQFLLWEVATAVAGRLLGINPFDQPDVESAKQAARDIMEQGAGEGDDPVAVDDAVEIRAGSWLPPGTSTLQEAVEALTRQLDPARGYLAVMVYLDRLRLAGLASVQADLVRRTGRPVTFGWGPRFLHSTGQYHKGGPAQGVYLQVTGAPEQDLAVPGKDYTFGEFITAQAAGDAAVLAEHGRPVLRLHLTDQARGLEQLRAALG